MSESLEAVLVGATQAALERTAFLFADLGAPPAAEDGVAEVTLPPFAATVAFSGAHEGAFSIEFPARLLPVLATNVLGEEDAPGEEMQRDALGELANIICGNVLPALDPAGKYSLGPPVVGGMPAVVAGDAVRVAFGDLNVEGEKVGTSLWLRAPGSTVRSA
jgi:CheY-specific phosphatase CheX